MGVGPGGVSDHLYLPGDSPVHGLPPAVKIAALGIFVSAVVVTPATQVWAFGVLLGCLLAVGLVAGLSARRTLPRLVVEVPFLVFALLMPLTGPAPYLAFGGLSLSEPGLWAAWGILAKGTLGVLGSVILAATTPSRGIVHGLAVLRMPAPLLEVVTFMLRYVDVVSDEMQRMRVARQSRGFDVRGPAAWPVLARSVSGLFIRSYERGERVHLAMLSRGYSGRIPLTAGVGCSGMTWAVGLAPAAVAWGVCLAALMLR
jgi:cobalt/nickel transport system permease protein